MKKKLLSFVFALLVMSPCAFLLTACGNSDRDDKYMEVIVVGNDDPGIVGVTLYDADSYSKYDTHSYFHWQKGKDSHGSMIPKGKNYLLMVEYTPGYANGNLHVYINGEQSMFRKLAYELEEIGNPNYVDFQDDEIYVDLWKVTTESVNTITVTFGGQTELEKYDVQMSHIPAASRTSIANYEDLRFSVTVNGEEQLDQGEVVDGLAEGATFEQFEAYFADIDSCIKNLIYGDQIIFKVWFAGRLAPFNNADLFSTYEMDDTGYSWYNPCARSYFDPATGESVYIFNIESSESINMFWTRDNQTEQTINYNQVSLSLSLEGINNGDFTASESYTFEKIKNIFDNEGNVTFSIPNFKAINAKILQSSFETLDIGYQDLTNNEKAQIISYDNVTNVLTLTFNKYAYQYYLGNLIFNDQGEDHNLAGKPRLMSSGDYRVNPNEYSLRFYHDSENLYHNLITDGAWQTTPVIKLTHEYNGTEFNQDYEFEDQSHIHKTLWMEEDVQATVLNDSIMVFSGDDLVRNGGITFEMSFDFFPAPTLDEDGGYSSDSDLSRFEKITVTIGEAKFNITVEEGTGIHTDTGEEYTYYYFITDYYSNSIDGLTVYDCTDNDENIFVQSGNVQFVLTDGFINAQKPHDTSIKFEYYLKNA